MVHSENIQHNAYCMVPNFCSTKFLYKPFILKKLIFEIKFLWISINFMKIQIDKAYYISSIRRQKWVVFHMHAMNV